MFGVRNTIFIRIGLKFVSFRLDGIYSARGTNHLQLLNRFSLLPLELKRIIMHLKFLYGLLHNQIDSIALLESVNLRVPFFQSRSQLTFTYKTPRINAMYNSPVQRMCRYFNIYCSSCDIFYQTFNSIVSAASSNYNLL